MYRIIDLVHCGQILITIIGLENTFYTDLDSFNARLINIEKRSDEGQLHFKSEMCPVS